MERCQSLVRRKKRGLGGYFLKRKDKKSYGANYQDGVWFFKVYSSSATQVDLVLFEAEDTKHPVHKITLDKDNEGNFFAEVGEDLDGFLYGYQLRSAEGASQILLDPYATEIGQTFSNRSGVTTPALGVLRFPSFFDWQGVQKPYIAYDKSVIYEGHVKGLTALNLKIAREERGTFLALRSEEFISHLKTMGGTAIELLPIWYHIDEKFLLDAQLKNYWGYNPASFFALSGRFISLNSSLQIRDQFKTVVRELHRVGIEVILDVVFNHSGEGSFKNPQIVSLRGLDEAEYYRGTAAAPIDFTGCGNTLNTDRLKTVQLICDSLRYWAGEMQVDGFRFDLTSAIARSGLEFNPNHPLLVAIAQDPVLSRVKLIAEPWDGTAEGYQLGKYPHPWREWNDRYRDYSRRFWRGDGGILGEFVNVLAGSSAVFQGNNTRSINFITAHDGFTLRDLVSYSEKNNQENAQNGEDGANTNWSFNCGIEGETLDNKVNELRLRQRKNLLGTLFLSKGVPMLLGGDELAKSQRGNNNAYCHDVDWNYLNWEPLAESTEMIEWIRTLSKLRTKINVINSEAFFQTSDVRWLNFEGTELTLEEWKNEAALPFVMLIRNAIDKLSLLVALNPTSTPRLLRFPAELKNTPIYCLVSSDPDLTDDLLKESLVDENLELELNYSSFTAFSTKPTWDLSP